MLSKLLTGLSFAGKAMLGAGVAVAATGGAGAAGALPAPVQHAFAVVVDHATPFEVPDGSGSNETHGVTSEPTSEPTTAPSSGEHEGDTSTTDAPETPTTETPTPETPTTEVHNPNDGHGTGSHEPQGPPATTPGDGHHLPNPGDDNHGDHQGDNPGDNSGDHHTQETMSLTCALADATVHCSWTGGTLGDGDAYVLLRMAHGVGRAFRPDAGATSYDDSAVEPDTHYAYMVIIVHDGATANVARSNRAYVQTPPKDNSGDGSGGGTQDGPGDGGSGSHDGSGDGGTGSGSGDHTDSPPTTVAPGDSH